MQFERETGITFPAGYRTFLLTHNGGRPTPCEIAVPDWHGRETTVSFLYGIHRGHEYDLRPLEQILPEEYLAIGEDPGGNLFVMGLFDPNKEKIFFWDHEQQSFDLDGRISTECSLISLSSNFAAFMDKILADSSGSNRL